MDPKNFRSQLESLAALDDPVRRKLYLHVIGAGRDVGRDEASRATRVSRALAAFHLDKLVEAGLLEATFRRLSGREGPGAGRPAKLYRRSSAQFDVTLPQRRYEVASHVLMQALAGSEPESTLEALRVAAREWGRRLAKESRTSSGRGGAGALRRAAQALKSFGFEPRRTSGRDAEVTLGNCPFDSLRSDSGGLVCTMNLALIEGLLEGLGLEEVEARLCPRAEMCCVALRAWPDEDG